MGSARLFCVSRAFALELAFIVVVLSSTSSATASILAQWTFETSVPTTAGPFAAEGGSNAATSFASGLHAGAAVYSNPVGNGSNESFSSTIWAVGDYYQFTTNSLGFENITLSWSQSSSNTGPRDFNLLYDFGSGFTQFGSYAVLANAAPNPVWSSGSHQAAYDYSFDLSSIAGLDNKSTIRFRLVDASTTSANGGTVAAAGTNRVDDFTISGTAIVTRVVPEASALLVWSVLCGSVLMGAKRLRDVA